MTEPLATIHVIVVDDDRLVRRAMVRTLRRIAQVTVEDFASGDQAIARAETTPFDVAVLDLMMPILDGVEVAQRLLEKLPALRLIFVTADPTCNLALRARELKPHGILPKPWPATELAKLLRG